MEEHSLVEPLSDMTSKILRSTSSQLYHDLHFSSQLQKKGHATVAANRIGGPVNLYYEIHGSADAPSKLLFIMGLNACCYSWDAQLEFFMEHPQYQMCIFDNRGVGRSSSPVGKYKTSEMAKDTFELMQQIGWTRDIHVIGMSMGGMITQELLLHAPKGTFASAVLTSTHSGLTIAPFKTLVRLPRIDLSAGYEERSNMLIDLMFPKPWLDEQAVERQSKNSQKNPKIVTNFDKMKERLRKLAKKTEPQHPDGARGQVYAVMTHHVSRRRLLAIRNLDIPFLVITGDSDDLIRPSNSGHLAKYLNAALVILPQTGHGVPSQRSDQYNQLLLFHVQNASKAVSARVAHETLASSSSLSAGEVAASCSSSPQPQHGADGTDFTESPQSSASSSAPNTQPSTPVIESLVFSVFESAFTAQNNNHQMPPSPSSSLKSPIITAMSALRALPFSWLDPIAEQPGHTDGHSQRKFSSSTSSSSTCVPSSSSGCGSSSAAVLPIRPQIVRQTSSDTLEVTTAQCSPTLTLRKTVTPPSSPALEPLRLRRLGSALELTDTTPISSCIVVEK